MPDWPFPDGNHRLAAAALVNAQFLVVRIDGDWERGLALLVEERDPEWAYHNL